MIRRCMKQLVMFVMILNSVACFEKPPPTYTPTPTVESVVLDVPFVKQEAGLWCWVAVAEMAIRYQNSGLAPSQCRMVEWTDHLPAGKCCAANRPLFCDRPGSPLEVLNLIEAYGGRAKLIPPPQGPEEVRKTLSRGRPMIAYLKNQVVEGDGFELQVKTLFHHVVIVRGITVRRVAGEQVAMLVINDSGATSSEEVAYDVLRKKWHQSLAIEPPPDRDPTKTPPERAESKK